MLRVTIDTNVLDRDRNRMQRACEPYDVEIKPTTVTPREHPGHRAPPDDSLVHETGVYGEGTYGSAVYGSPESGVLLQGILGIITNGSQPTQWQRRDGLILEAHTRDARDVLVSDDATAFINYGRRSRLEELCQTRILTVREFCDQAASLAERRERLEELMATFGVSRQQAAQMLQAEKGEIPADRIELTDDELAASFVRTYGMTEGMARELVEIQRGRLEGDVKGGLPDVNGAEFWRRDDDADSCGAARPALEKPA